jgi:hypothetical protein
MIDRVFKSWKSTLAGVILFASGMVLVGIEKATLTEAGAFFGIAFVLFFTKEKINE